MAGLRAGDPAAAEAKIDHALAILGRASAPSESAIAQAWTVRGDARAALGRRREAIADLERALALRERIAAPAEVIAATRGSLAQVLWPDDRRRADHLARLAIAGYEAAGELGPAHAGLVAWRATHRVRPR